jgi:ABC-type branched-subunit amino acid transport system substrate-binding protein
VAALSRRRFLLGPGVLASAWLLARCGLADATLPLPRPWQLAVVDRPREADAPHDWALWRGAELALATASPAVRRLLVLAEPAGAPGDLAAFDALLAAADSALPCAIARPAPPGAHAPMPSAAGLYLAEPRGGPEDAAGCRLARRYWLAPGAGQLARPLGAWARRELGQRAAILYTDAPWARALAAAFRRGFAGERTTVVAEQPLPLEVTALAALLDARRPELVFIAADGEALTRCVDAYGAAGLWRRARPLAAVDACALASFRRLGAPARGLIAATGWLPTADTPANRAFVDAYRARFGREPSALAVQGYEATRLLLAAAETLAGEPADRATLAGALARAQVEGPRGSVRIDVARGGLVQDIYLVELKARREQLVPVALERVAAVEPEG